jgi:hypothetical protein
MFLFHEDSAFDNSLSVSMAYFLPIRLFCGPIMLSNVIYTLYKILDLVPLPTDKFIYFIFRISNCEQYIYIYIYIYVCVCVCVRVCVYIYIYTYIYTCIYRSNEYRLYTLRVTMKQQERRRKWLWYAPEYS